MHVRDDVVLSRRVVFAVGQLSKSKVMCLFGS